MEASSEQEGIELASDLWIDQPDAAAEIDRKRSDGEIDDSEASLLRSFHEDGFALASPAALEAIDPLSNAFDEVWRARPPDLLYASDGHPRWMSVADESSDRKAGYRIHDGHSHLESARALYLDERLHSIARLIAGEDVVAIQSLLFELGSRQVLHRDPIVVPTGAPGHLFAAWIALEDIVEGSGELVYVPGSHRLPYYEFEPGQYMFDASRMGAAEIEAATQWFNSRMERKGLHPVRHTPKKGTVLFWHASLHHGGGPITDPNLTRRSFVVHFSPKRSYHSRSITVAERNDAGEETMRILETTRLIRDGDREGFANPAAG